MATILVVADRPSTESLVNSLQHEQHNVETDHAIESAMTALRQRRYDLVILKREFSALGTEDLCRDFRSASPNSAILMVCDSPDVDDLECALYAGADDYVAYTTDPREVRARVRALARRYGRRYI